MQPESLLICRADADSKIGTGHVMRCIALADAWRATGGEAVLAGSFLGPLRDRAAASFSSIVSVDQESSPAETCKAIQQAVRSCRSHSAWITLDGYRFDAEWQCAISELGYPLLVIDDYAHQDYYHCDLILNQNAGAERFNYRTKANTKLLLGTDYVLLREDLLQGREMLDRVEGEAHILVTMGGIDAPNMTQRVLGALARIDKALPIRVLMGSGNPHIDSVSDFARETLQHTEVIVQAKDMSEHYRWTTTAISAAGTTSWELCYYGIPSLMVRIADNQCDLAEHLSRTGAAVDLGWYENVTQEKVLREVNRLLSDFQLRSEMSRNAQTLVDGCGGQRVIREMEKLAKQASEPILYADSRT